MWILKISRMLLISLALLPGVETARAERKYRVGTQIDLVSGTTSRSTDGGIDATQPLQDRTFFYALYPSLALTSAGDHSLLEVSYAFGLNRTNTGLNLDNGSHVASATFKASLNPRWRYTLAESFEMTSDFTTLNVLRGTMVTPEEYRFLFYPVATRRSSQVSNASASVETQINDKSSLSFGVSHGLRNYPDIPLLRGILSDQQRIAGNVTYTRRTSERNSWTLNYAGTYYSFRDFQGSNTHAVTLGYSRSLSPTMTLQVAAGPSFTQLLSSGGNYATYDASVALMKRLKPNVVSLYYSYASGQGSGLGSISDTQHAGFGFSRPVGKKTSLAVDISAFDSRGRLGNAYGTRGASGAATVGVALNKTLSLNIGGQYQRYDGTAIFGFEDRRVFASLRFLTPDLWRFAR